MPESTVALGGEELVVHETHDALSGTRLHKAIGAGAGAAVETALKAGAEQATMGLVGVAAKLSNVAAITIICAGIIFAFMWLRNDAMDERRESRAVQERQEKKDDQRREQDRADRQRTEDLFRTTLDNVTRDNRETLGQMKEINVNLKVASDQMRAASETMSRVEKLLTSKMP